MEYIKLQISELILKYAEKENGLNDLMEIMLESMMLAERTEFLKDNPGNKGNGFRPGHAYGHGKILSFRIPRGRFGNTNRWGEDTRTIEGIVEITSGTGIGSVDENKDFSVYPNPFVESVNFRFVEAGDYTINIYGVDGTLMQTNNLTAGAGQVVNVTLAGSKGMYVVKVVKNGKTYKTVKVVKK